MSTFSLIAAMNTHKISSEKYNPFDVAALAIKLGKLAEVNKIDNEQIRDEMEETQPEESIPFKDMRNSSFKHVQQQSNSFQGLDIRNCNVKELHINFLSNAIDSPSKQNRSPTKLQRSMTKEEITSKLTLMAQNRSLMFGEQY